MELAEGFRYVEVSEGKGYIVLFSPKGVLFDKEMAEEIIDNLNQEQRNFEFDVRSEEVIDYGI